MTGTEVIALLTEHFRRFSSQGRQLRVAVPGGDYDYVIKDIISTPMGPEIQLARREG